MRTAVPTLVAVAFAGCSNPSTNVASPPVDGPPWILVAEPHVVRVGDPFTLNVIGGNLGLPLAVTVSRETDLSGAAVSGPTVSATTTPIEVPQETGGHASVSLTLPETGIYSLSLAGAVPKPSWFVVYPPTTVQTPDPNVFCYSESRSLTLQGSFVDFFVLQPVYSRQLPYVAAFKRDGRAAIVANLASSNCTPIPFSRDQEALCTTLTLHFIEALDSWITPLNQDLGVSMWPGPGLPVEIDLLAEKSSEVQPIGDFAVGDTAVPIAIPFAANPFVMTADRGPTVTLDGTRVQGTASQCSDSSLPGEQLCEALTAVVPAGTPPGEHTLSVTTISGCTAGVRFVAHLPPQITAVGPAPLCVGNDYGSAHLTGIGFHNAIVIIDDTRVDWNPASCGGETCLTPNLGGIKPGSHVAVVVAYYQQYSNMVPVRSPPFAFDVAPGPMQLLSGASPSVFAAGAERPLFVRTQGETGQARGAFLINAEDGGMTAAAATDVDGGVVVTTPADAGAGSYLVAVQDDSPCLARAPYTGISLLASPVVESLDFTDGGESALFGTLFPSAAAAWDSDAGALTATASGLDAEYFQVGSPLAEYDLGLLRFDLSACAPGAGQPRAATVLVLGSGYLLSRPLDAPSCGWTHYDVPLAPAGWTYTANGASRPAVPDDFVQIAAFLVPATFSDGGAPVELDNVVVELAH